MRDLIQIDENAPEYCSIDTGEFLEQTLGREVLDGGELEKILSKKWLMQCEYDIKAALHDETGTRYKCTEVDNVYNHENDFSSVFQYQIFYPESESDFYYCDDVFVAVEIHQGGDVRGNYGRPQIFRVDNVAESGFFNWVLGWSVNYSDGREVPENDRFSIGYAKHPFYEMQGYLKNNYKTPVFYSKKRGAFLSIYNDGRFVEIRPDFYI